MEPCQQTTAISQISSKIDRLAEALQVLAVQKNEISHLVRHQGDHREWLKGHEKRLQDLEKRPEGSAKHEQRIDALEKRPGDSASRLFWVVLTAGAGTSGGFVSALAVWLITKG